MLKVLSLILTPTTNTMTYDELLSSNGHKTQRKGSYIILYLLFNYIRFYIQVP